MKSCNDQGLVHRARGLGKGQHKGEGRGGEGRGGEGRGGEGRGGEGGECHVVNCSLDYSKAITASANLSTYFFFFTALAISELHN